MVIVVQVVAMVAYDEYTVGLATITTLEPSPCTRDRIFMSHATAKTIGGYLDYSISLWWRFLFLLIIYYRDSSNVVCSHQGIASSSSPACLE